VETSVETDIPPCSIREGDRAATFRVSIVNEMKSSLSNAPERGFLQQFQKFAATIGFDDFQPPGG
jgi:hypothetical protein